jgi:hypothetical protein
MHIPFISKPPTSSVPNKTSPNNTNGIVVLTDKEYQAVAGAPEVQNEPE